jgi:formate hydrogenlyase subunit 3/multisubunit Na+/H+ antiporter MnhD subunit
MLSGIVIEIGLLALLRALSALAGVTDSWSFLLMGFGALNMIYGNLMALRQIQVKRLLAYSSLSHVGYILLGLGIAFFSHQGGGAQGAFFHIFNHGIMKGLAFLSAGALLYALKLSQGNHDPLVVADLAGAARRYPLPALALSVAVLGLGGLPPLAGFMSKWQIFAAGFSTKDTLVICLVIFAALNSVLSLAYYAPLVNTMYRNQPGRAVIVGGKIPTAMLIPLGVLAGLVLLLGFWPGLMDWLVQPASQSLLAGL